GKWSFDAENRERWPKGLPPPLFTGAPRVTLHQEAEHYVQENFVNNPGAISGTWEYPVTHSQASDWLDQFLQHRFAGFGRFEDAMVSRESVLHHSVITPMLNTGLLTIQQVLDRTIDFAREHQVPFNSVEGFVRQVVGWREFIRAVYVREGRKQRTTNYWGFTRPMPASFYDGTTGIVPVDSVIKKLLATGYSHHIERLMVLGNFMLLCEIHPDAVYKWFMELYVDAYDWVMVPNVYGMSQFADGGLMCTKPYISGSNYLLKMSDFRADPSWTSVWDALFWRFMHVHRDFFGQNPRLGMLLRTLDKMDAAKRNALLMKADEFLTNL
ncbi:MAG: cryptochrome/photolyase family protein, partial [Bacteroidota bacterium]